jgi:hypothetical protein
MLSVLIVVMLSVATMSAVMLSVVALSVIMLKVILLSVAAPLELTFRHLKLLC